MIDTLMAWYISPDPISKGLYFKDNDKLTEVKRVKGVGVNWLFKAKHKGKEVVVKSFPASTMVRRITSILVIVKKALKEVVQVMHAKKVCTWRSTPPKYPFLLATQFVYWISSIEMKVRQDIANHWISEQPIGILMCPLEELKHMNTRFSSF